MPVRAQALRRAQEVGQAREARRRARELEVENVLAEYFESAVAADRLLDQARERAAAILATAEKVAADSKRRGTTALHRLFRLGETRASISELTGLTPAEVRTVLAGVRRGNPAPELGQPVAAAEGHAVAGSNGTAQVEPREFGAVAVERIGAPQPAGARAW